MRLGVKDVDCGDRQSDGKTTSRIEGNSFVIRNVRVFDGERVVERANVVVRVGRITYAGRGRPPAGLPGTNCEKIPVRQFYSARDFRGCCETGDDPAGINSRIFIITGIIAGGS